MTGHEKSPADRRQRARLIVATGLLLSTTVTWRQGDYYSGGVDPTVIAKAFLGLVAAALAWQAARHTERGCLRRHTLNLSMPVYLAGYGLFSLFGAWSTGGLLLPSAILLARLALIAFTVWQLLCAFEPLAVLRVFAYWMAVVTAMTTLTGSTAGSLRSGAGRLVGGIPPLVPNEIAELCALCILLLLWYDLRGRGRTWDAVAVVVLLGVQWLSGSRTTLAFLLVAMLVMVTRLRRFSFGFVVTLLAVLPLGAYAALGTDAAGHFFNRGGSANVGTLSQRTVAWSAALHVHHGFWEVAFGDGLARTSIPVVAKYRSTQILDSTWISALVQGGVVGVVVLACWIVNTVRRAWRTGGDERALYAAFAVFVVGLSFLESGLIGSSPLFVIFLVLGMSGGRVPPKTSADTEHLRAIFARRPDRTRVATV